MSFLRPITVLVLALAASSSRAALVNIGNPSSGKSYWAGEIATAQTWTYARYEGVFRTAQGSGLVSSLFTYHAGPVSQANEIDVENLGRYTDETQFNVFSYNNVGHPYVQNLCFNPHAEFHHYAIESVPGEIRWFVDHTLVYTDNRPYIAAEMVQPQHLMMNLWPYALGPVWAGNVDDSALPAYAYYDWVRVSAYTPGSGNTGTNNDFTIEWTDDFNTLNTSRWNISNWTFDSNAGHFTPANVIVQNGLLILGVTQAPWAGHTGVFPSLNSEPGAFCETATPTPMPTPDPGPGQIIDDFNDDTRYNANSLNLMGAYTSDDGTLVSDTVSGGALALNSNGTGYWYSVLPGSCYDAGSALWLRLVIRGAAGGEQFTVRVNDKDVGCATETAHDLPIASYTTLTTGWQTVLIPLDDFGVNAGTIASVMLTNFNGASTVYLDEISLIGEYLGTYTPTPTTSPTFTALPTPDPFAGFIVDDFDDDDRYNVSHLNVLAGYTDDDASLLSDSVSGGALTLESDGTGYWYSVLPGGCYDASSYLWLKLVVRGSVGGEVFSVELDDKDPTCTTTSYHAVNVAAYATLTTSWQTILIPFTDFGVDPSYLSAILLTNFSGATTIEVDEISFVSAYMTRTATPTASVTSTSTPSASPSPTATPSRTATGSATPSASPTATLTASPSATPVDTATATASATPSITNTPTASSTQSATATATPSSTNTPTVSSTATPSRTVSPTATVTTTSSRTASVTETNTPVPPGSTETATPTASPTFTYSPSVTVTGTPSGTPSATPTHSPSASATVSPTSTVTATASVTASPTGTVSPTETFTATFSRTASPTSTPTASVSSTVSSTPTESPVWTSTATISASPSPTLTGTATLTPTLSSTLTPTPTMTMTLVTPNTATTTPSPTPSQSVTASPSMTATTLWTPVSTSTLTSIPTATPYPTEQGGGTLNIVWARVAPNPVRDSASIHVELEGRADYLTLELFTKSMMLIATDQTGGPVMDGLSAHPLTFLDGLSNGLYYIRVTAFRNGAPSRPKTAKLHLLR